ncbi:MAG: RNA-directed DNA polymerase [Bacteroides sp.]|nr:RNA-directed DNA polymerase [Bacteroides sp.]
MEKSILKLDAKKAREFFLEEESYCNFDLPPYIKFSALLNAINNKIGAGHHEINEFYSKSKKPEECENVNYKLFNNKNAKYDWRPFELIHPVLYVFLVREITEETHWKDIQERFKELNKNSLVQCFSIPISSETNQRNKAEQVLQWWNHIEQDSIKYSLEFDYLFHTDITNFYPSIYTHSIAWALHDKTEAKKEKLNKKLLGNKIDDYIRKMSHAQSNGIPQGSVLMDFIAEIILAYIDDQLTEKIRNQEIESKNFRIIRYRDDYRIFVNNPQNAESILKALSEILADTGLKLNPSKTIVSQNVIQGSIKQDKLKWIFIEPLLKEQDTLQKQLLILHQFSLEYENSGILINLLDNLLKDLTYNVPEMQVVKNEKYKSLFKINLNKENKEILVAILIDIVSLNPRTYPLAMAILGILFSRINKKEFIITSIQKLERIYNNSYMQIWLQRAIIKQEIDYKNFTESICQKVASIFSGKKCESLWNNEWLSCEEMKKLFKKYPIILKEEIDNLTSNTQHKEITLFNYDNPFKNESGSIN